MYICYAWNSCTLPWCNCHWRPGSAAKLLTPSITPVCLNCGGHSAFFHYFPLFALSEMLPSMQWYKRAAAFLQLSCRYKLLRFLLLLDAFIYTTIAFTIFYITIAFCIFYISCAIVTYYRDNQLVSIMSAIVFQLLVNDKGYILIHTCEQCLRLTDVVINTLHMVLTSTTKSSSF